MNNKNLENVKKVLFVIDMVNGFVREGAMKSQNIEHIVPEVQRLVKQFTEDDDKLVVFVKDTHEVNDREFKRFPPHCLRGSTECQLIDELKPYEEGAHSFEKRFIGAMFINGLVEDIQKMHNIEEITLVGCCTDICIISIAMPLQTLFDEQNRDVSIVVPKNAVETYDSPDHNAEEWDNIAFKFMEHGGVKIIDKYGE
jgi:nicotinamidase-related amidase